MKLPRWMLSLLLVGLAFGCGKDDDDDDDKISANALMTEIDVGCGDGDCITVETALLLDGDETFAQTARLFYQMVVGYPDEDTYKASIPVGAREIIKQDGLIGKITGAREHVVETVLANYDDIETCEDAPTSGSVDADDGTISFAAGKNTAPASFPKTGTYDKRAVYANTEDDYTATFEWFCDYAGMMVTYEEELGDDALRYVFYYDREEEAEGHFEFFLNDDSGNISGDQIAIALKVQIDESEEEFRIWQTRTGEEDGGLIGYRFAAHANYTTQKTSLMYQDIASNPRTQAAWDAHDAVADDTITGGVAFSAGSQEDKRQGCVDNFDADMESISSSALCTGLALSQPDEPGIDSDGDWSMGWVQENLGTLLDDLM